MGGPPVFEPGQRVGVALERGDDRCWLTACVMSRPLEDGTIVVQVFGEPFARQLPWNLLYVGPSFSGRLFGHAPQIGRT